jgi:heme exporter protein D
MSEFFAMGGYAFYVWGSYGVTLGLIVVELVLLVRRRRGILARLAGRR